MKCFLFSLAMLSAASSYANSITTYSCEEFAPKESIQSTLQSAKTQKVTVIIEESSSVESGKTEKVSIKKLNDEKIAELDAATVDAPMREYKVSGDKLDDKFTISVLDQESDLTGGKTVLLEDGQDLFSECEKI